MYQFSSNTKVEQTFKINDLLKMIKADKDIRLEAKNIVSIQMTNALSEKTTGLKPSSEVNEIYVIRVDLNNKNIPYEFIKALDKTIRFQVLYVFFFESEVKYLTTYKIITDDKLSQIRSLESEWQNNEPKEMPLVSNLTEVYKTILIELYSLTFRQNETIKQWFERITEIEHLQKEFNKVEKLMNSEIQPKKKFEYNEKLRQIYQKIKDCK